MNRGVFQSSPVMGGSSAWWSLSSMIRPPPQEIINPSPLLHPPLPMPSPWQEIQELPESWSQLLLGGLVGEEERCSFSALLQHKRLEENWEDPMVEVKQESPESGYVYGNSSSDQEIQMNRYIPVASSPRSCVTTFSSSMLDFSNSTTKVDHSKHPKPDLSPECNSTATGAPYKKARVQGSSSAQSTFKVRKEKLGDRITALHQLVSPFGKTDTASVLLEAIGYIRFLQNQIEALSSPYMGNAPSSTRPPSSDIENKQKKDLRSRGLCLVPLSCTMHVENDNGADFWAPTIGGAYR